MIFRSQYRVDLVDLKHSNEPELVRGLMEEEAARKLGMAICKQFPHQRNEQTSYVGELPEVCITRDHQFKDDMQLDLYVIDRARFEQVVQWLRRGQIENALQLLTTE